MNLIEIGSAYIDLDKVCAIEKGDWSNSRQDWKAVFVFSNGGRVIVDMYCKDAAKILNAGGEL